MSENRFKQPVIVTLAKRAANRCSNPDCKAITSGPSDDPAGSVNVGEAAHIYGAHPGSARYDPAMESVDRAAISNAIWLCGNCHKLIDDDENGYPAGLLFEWQKLHTEEISRLVGKAGAEARARFQERQLEEFGRLSYLAERLIREKEDFWEYNLTAEVLRFEMSPILQRWRALQSGLYMRSIVRVKQEDAIKWTQDRDLEVQHLCSGFDGLMNGEFQRAWGEPGVAGNELDIIQTCRLFREMAANALAWEETVRFTILDDPFDALHALYIGVAGQMIDEAAKLPAFIEQVQKGGFQEGTYRLSLVVSLPEEWVDRVKGALTEAADALIRERARRM